MRKIVPLMLATAVIITASGCALVSRHTAPVESGKKTTVGLFGFSAVDNGYPLIPLYTGYEQGK